MHTCAPASPLTAIPPKVKGHISRQLPGCIRCDNSHPAAALPSSLLLDVLLLSPAGLHWAHTHTHTHTHTRLNVGQRPLTQGFGYMCGFFFVFVLGLFIRVKQKMFDMRRVERLAARYLSYLEGGISIFKAVENSGFQDERFACHSQTRISQK